MRRWLFNFLAGISFLLCIATTLLWARSYRIADDLYIHHPPAYASRWAWPYFGSARSTWGGLELSFVRPAAPDSTREMRRILTDFPQAYALESRRATFYPQARSSDRPPGFAAVAGAPRHFLGVLREPRRLRDLEHLLRRIPVRRSRLHVVRGAIALAPRASTRETPNRP